jgi:MFS family permease
MLGRLIDRHGPRRILLACALVFPSALLLLVGASARDDLAWLAFLAAAAAGASFPPITVCMRTYFRQVLADDALLAAAYSAESVLIEIIFIVGPLVVALFVAFASPAMAVCFSAGCGFVGPLLFLRSPALRAWRVESRTTRGMLGPLVSREFVRLVAIVLCFASAFGFLEIGITAYAIERADAAFAGVLLGLMSAGSALGGARADGFRPHAAGRSLGPVDARRLVRDRGGGDRAGAHHPVHAGDEDRAARTFDRSLHLDDERAPLGSGNRTGGRGRDA